MLTKIEGKRIFSNGAVINHTVEYKTTNWATRRYGSGFQVNDPRGVGHVGVLGEITQESLNKRLTDGTMPEKAQGVLDSFGLVDDINELDHADLHFLRSTNGYSAMRVILDAIRASVPTVPGTEPPTTTPPGVDFVEYPGMPPLNKTPGGPDTVYERVALYGLVNAATAYDGPLGQKWYAIRYYQNKLVPGVNEESWMLSEHGLRPLPEQAAVREDGIYRYDQLELRIAEWGLALAENQSGIELRQDAARKAYWAFEECFVPKQDGGVPPAFGDRVCNPRSVLYAGRFIENAIEHGLPNSAAWCGPRAAFTLGAPQHFSRYEAWGFSTQPLQSRDWRGVLGLAWADDDTGEQWPGGPVVTPIS